MKIKKFSILICMLLLIPVFSATVAANNPPNPPEIEGPVSGSIKETYIYNFTVTDPDEEDYLLTLEIDWGDGTETETCGCSVPWSNGEIVQVEHRWRKTGSYEIKARVADVYNYWSEWSDPFSVSMPKDKFINKFSNMFINLLLEKFPILEQLINIIWR